MVSFSKDLKKGTEDPEYSREKIHSLPNAALVQMSGGNLSRPLLSLAPKVLLTCHLFDTTHLVPCGAKESSS